LEIIGCNTVLSIAVAILISSDFSSDIEGESAGRRSVSDSNGATSGNNDTFGILSASGNVEIVVIFEVNTSRGARPSLREGQTTSIPSSVECQNSHIADVCVYCDSVFGADEELSVLSGRKNSSAIAVRPHKTSGM